jgi:acyl carrier protein
LKLDADVTIPNDMPLMEGEYDIDSLDVLLIVTELERAFDVVIEDGAMQPTDLRTIDTLSGFIEGLCESSPTRQD